MENFNETITPIETNVKLIKKEVEKSIIVDISFGIGLVGWIMSDSRVSHIVAAKHKKLKDKADKKRIFDSLFQFLNASISWWSNNQSVVTLSSCEAKYSCFTSILSNSILGQKSNCTRKKQAIETKFHFLRDQVCKGRLELVYCCIELQVTNFLLNP
ncbi:hypothetical protein CR513_27346, partial [Mucuna pruriens]